MISDDKRLLSDGPMFWYHRESEREWHYCKYCYHETPTFKFFEGLIGSLEPTGVMRCCWECGSGIEILA